ncbi:hypothetical protein BaRGS_00040073, partial [Batillaria attramentaria]
TICRRSPREGLSRCCHHLWVVFIIPSDLVRTLSAIQDEVRFVPKNVPIPVQQGKAKTDLVQGYKITGSDPVKWGWFAVPQTVHFFHQISVIAK